MAHAVVSVDEDATFKEIVETLARRRVSAVAVIDGERKVIGVISESDLLAKMVAGGDPRGACPWGPLDSRPETLRVACGDSLRSGASRRCTAPQR
jgi:CBS domain containing-hemolysin-like protein